MHVCVYLCVCVCSQRWAQFESSAPSIDVWGAQVYRGRDFGVGNNDFLLLHRASSKKPLLVTEYGIDAYKDPCGMSSDAVCYNTVNDPPATWGVDENTHADWNTNLARLLLNHDSTQVCVCCSRFPQSMHVRVCADGRRVRGWVHDELGGRVLEGHRCSAHAHMHVNMLERQAERSSHTRTFWASGTGLTCSRMNVRAVNVKGCNPPLGEPGFTVASVH